MSTSLMIATGNIYAALGLIQQARQHQPRMVRMTDQKVHPKWAHVVVNSQCSVCEQRDYPVGDDGLCRVCSNERRRIWLVVRPPIQWGQPHRRLTQWRVLIDGRWVPARAA
jgi:hypothetical protein